MPRDTSAERGLIVEAVSLVVQRQRETETWVAKRVCQAEERVAEAERRYAALESRLAGMEEHLACLRAQLTAPPVVEPVPVAVAEPHVADEPPVTDVPPPRVAVTRRRASNVGFWSLLGATREDRASAVLIGLGSVAVLFALLTQLRVA